MAEVMPLLDDEVQIELFSLGLPWRPGGTTIDVEDNGHDVFVQILSVGYPQMQPPRVHMKVSIDYGLQIFHITLHVGTCRRLVLTDRSFPDNALYVDRYGGEDPNKERS